MKKNKLENDKLFNDNFSIIENLCINNWIPAEIAKKINMERHSLMVRLKRHNLQINKRNVNLIDKKVCFKCKKILPFDDFTKKAKCEHCYSSQCKECRKSKIENNKEKFILYQIKNRSKRNNIEFDLTIDDIIIPEKCPILGVKLNLRANSKDYKFAPSVDRIDPSKGYIKGNIMIISMKANLMKNNASVEELLNFSNYFINKYPVGTENIINVFK